MGEDIPDEVSELLAERVVSLEQLEALLAIGSDRAHAWTLDDVAQRLHLAEGAVEPALVELTDNGLLRHTREHGVSTWRFAPRTAAIEHAVARLAEISDERRLEIMRMLSARAMGRIRNSAVRAFADAFIIKGKKDG